MYILSVCGFLLFLHMSIHSMCIHMSICSIILPTMFDIIPETIQIRRAGNFKVVYGVLPSATVAGALEACSASDALHQRFQGSKTHDVETWRDIGWLQYVAI